MSGDKDNFAKPAPPSEPGPSSSKSISNLTRLQRNVAEKQRRDKLNGYISELATIVPMVSMSSKRLDKTSILRLSAAHLRLSKSPLSSTKKLKKTFKWCPSFLTGDQVRDILESVDGFLIVTSSSGKVLFTSSSVERYLGHQNIDLIGHSLFMFIHPEDVDTVREEMEKLLTASLKNGDSDPAPRCSFRCRMKEKGQPRSEVSTYQHVHFTGSMTICDDEDENNKAPKSTAIVTHLFKAFVRIVDPNPFCQLSLEEATADEYITRHTLDGTIIFADHRLATITGHLPQEVTGMSAYKYILAEDNAIALFAHHLMFSNDKGTGMVVYRLRTRDEKFVYLKSVGSLQFDRATSQVDHFVCVNQHLSDEEGEAQLKYFTDRFIPHIQDSSTLTLMESVKAFQVVGLNSPSNMSAIKDILNLNKFPLFDNAKLGKRNPVENVNSVNPKASNSTLDNSSVCPQSQNYATRSNPKASNYTLDNSSVIPQSQNYATRSNPKASNCAIDNSSICPQSQNNATRSNPKASNYTLDNSSVCPQPQNYATRSNESCFITPQISSPLKLLPDKTGKADGSVSSALNNSQSKSKKDVLGANRKRRATDSVPAKPSLPNVKTVNNIVTLPESADRTLLSTKPVVMQNGDIITSLNIPSSNGNITTSLNTLSPNGNIITLNTPSNGLHMSSMPLQNVSVNEALLCTMNQTNEVAYAYNQYENLASNYVSDYQGLLRNAGCQTIDNSGFEQMHISDISASKNVNDIHLQVSPETVTYDTLIPSLGSECNGKVYANTNMSNTANIYDMPSEMLSDAKSNIMLSTSSVLYSNDLQKTVPKASVVNSNKLNSIANTFSTCKTKLSDSDQLSANVNDVVIETNLWPTGASSEMNVSDVASEDPLVSAVGSLNDPYLYLLPPEEMKDYLGDVDDISSVLNSSLPFDDSSLPSVDGWNEYLRPEDILSQPNINTVVNIDGEQHLINGYEEKSELW